MSFQVMTRRSPGLWTFHGVTERLANWQRSSWFVKLSGLEPTITLTSSFADWFLVGNEGTGFFGTTVGDHRDPFPHPY